MHKDFFLTAAMPVEKVFLMLVARRRDSWEIPSRPAMEPDRALVPPALLMNRELMIFLQDMHFIFSSNVFFYSASKVAPETLPVPSLLLGVQQEAGGIG